MDPGFDLRRYAAFLLDAPAILVALQEGAVVLFRAHVRGHRTRERTMTRAEVEHAASMFFTDVRLKTYIEIRPADALPVPYAIAYAALVKGLFYHPGSLDALDALLAEVRAGDIEEAKAALMAEGYRAEVYGRPAAAWADDLVALARAGLAEDERSFLDPLAGLVAARETLAGRAGRARA